MTRPATPASPPEPPGGGAPHDAADGAADGATDSAADGTARDLYDELTDDLLYDPAIGRATMMGYPCLRLAGKFLASYDDKSNCLVVKLPRERVAELVDTGAGNPFAPAGKVFREWVAVPAPDAPAGRGLWQQLLTEAVEFARDQLDEER